MIEHPAAYEAARKAYIIGNAQKTFQRTVEDHEAIIDWVYDNGHFCLIDDPHHKPENFAESLFDAYHYKYGKLTEGQCEAVRKAIAREAEWKATKKAEWIAKAAAERADAPDLPEGRIEITGVIVGEKVVESEFGEVRKITVKDDKGYVVYGSIPAAIENTIFYEWDLKDDGTDIKQAYVGRRLQFAAAVTPSKDDPKFGFYKRPTKPKLLDQSTAI